MEGQGEEPWQKKGLSYFLGSIRQAKLCDGRDKGGQVEKGRGAERDFAGRSTMG